MSRKVFISVLGTSNYRECLYGKDDFVVSTRFIQTATLDYLNQIEPWTRNDVVFILTTKGADEKNWQTHDDLNGLKDELKSRNYPFKCMNVSIEDGNNEKEIWSIFQSIYALLEDCDELYFDVTHSFRYLPMLVLVFGNYAKFLKHAKVMHISYGNFEGRDTITNVAPIMDLLPLSQLQDWTFAIAEYLEDGHSKRIKDMTLEELKPLLIDADTRKTASPLRKFSDCMHDLCSQMETCRGKDVVSGVAVKKIRQQLDEINHAVIPTLSPLLDKVKSDIEDFSSEKNVKSMFAAARWCFDHQQYQQSLTFLQEGVTTFFCEKYGIDIIDRNKRGLVNSALKIISEELAENEWIVDEENKEELKNLINSNLLNSDVARICSSLVGYRNDYNHCNMRKEKFTPDDIIKKIQTSLDKIESLLYPNEDTAQKEPQDVAPKIFLNISNHPFSLWSDEQLEAAKEYGMIEEMKFPKIEPDMTQNEIADLAYEWHKNIMLQYGDGELTVHIMGEMTFTYSLVSLLKESGVRCVASTTERNVEDDGDKKISVFRFVAYREY